MKTIKLLLLSLVICASVVAQVQETEQEKRRKKYTNFFTERMQELNNENLLDETQKQEIFKLFLELGDISPEKGTKMLYRIAVSRSIADTSTIYQLFKEEFETDLSIKHQEALEKYKTKYKLSEANIKHLADILYKQIREMRHNYYKYPDMPKEKEQHDNIIKEKYKEHIEFVILSEELQAATLQEKNIQDIKKEFLDIRRNTPEKGVKMSYKTAVCKTISDTTIIYQLFKEEFESTLKTRHKEAVDNYNKKYNLSKNATRLLSEVMYSQLREIRHNYYKYIDNAEEREQSDNHIKERYKDEIEFIILSDKLQNIPLKEEDIQEIRRTFLTIRKETPQIGYKKSFQFSIGRIIQDMDIIYQIFKQEIDSSIKEKTKALWKQIKNQYELTEEQMEYLSARIEGEAKELTMNNYRFMEDNQKIKEANAEVKKRYNKITQIYLTERGIKTELTKYCTALQIKKRLSLSKEQISQLVHAGYELSESNKQNKDFKLREEEHKRIKEILTNDQYEIYLAFRVSEKAKEETATIWNEATQLGITAELDSVTYYKQLLSFNLEKAKIRERYKIIPDSQQERDQQLEELQNNKPNVLRKINAIRKKGKTAQEQDINSLIW